MVPPVELVDDVPHERRENGHTVAHRGDAFAACESLVEAVKAEVPIWKKQYEVDGTHSWVGL